MELVALDVRDRDANRAPFSRPFLEEKIMPAKNPRIHVVLEKPLYDSVRRLAAKDEISLSLKIRDLVKEALEAQEDVVLTHIAEQREKTLRRNRGLSHKQAWSS
jgi:hypothetical protein